MSDDDPQLSSAWCARTAAGYIGPIAVELTPHGFDVIHHHPGTLGLVTRLATFHARYKAHAYAERTARGYDEPDDGGWFDDDTGRYRIPVAAYDRSDPPGEPSGPEPAVEPGEAP